MRGCRGLDDGWERSLSGDRRRRYRHRRVNCSASMDTIARSSCCTRVGSGICSAIVGIEKIRQHGAVYRDALNALRAGSSQSLPRVFGAEGYPDDEIQKALLNQFGLLGADVASDLVLFCNMLNGLRVDLKAIALGQLDNLSIAEKIRIIELDLKLWDDAQALGRKIVARL